MTLKFIVSGCIVTALAFSACESPAAKVSDAVNKKDTLPSHKEVTDPASIAGNFSEPGGKKFDSTAIDKFLKKYPDFSGYGNDLRKFYNGRQFSYAWYDAAGLIEQATSLHNRLLQIEEEGITRQFPYMKAFNSLMDDNDSLLNREPMNPEAELLLTAQYLNYARTVWQGVDEKTTTSMDWFIPRKKLSAQELLDSLLYDKNPSFISKEPIFPMYAKLKEYLRRYRDLQKSGSWPVVKTEKKSLRLNDEDPAVKNLRKALFLLGDLQGDTTKTVFDEELEKAVKQFQARHGWKEDGIAGPALIREINVPIQERIEQIMVNMERCRWVPYKLEPDYLLVNIPAYSLYVYESDSLAWKMNVVVGQTMHKTAIFNGKLKHVVFSPYWNVPPGILKNEILPGIRRNPNYLKNHNMEWSGQTVRQKPGPNNSLGKVKFLFPNSFNIYLHDTPAKSLFGEDQRAFSHGCIRLSEPQRLAEYLLRKEPGWDKTAVEKAMNAGTEKYVNLKKEVPVFIAYFTSWVGNDGKINFRKDVYNRDQRLADRLLK